MRPGRATAGRLARKAGRGVDARLGLVLCRTEIHRPVFIIGCGRSGTTILGSVLSQHPEVTYLNERRDLWSIAYPETDIWRADARDRGGRLSLTAADERPTNSSRLRRSFMWRTRRTGRPRLIEKLPINSFRLGFLRNVFPEATYVHMRRDGLEVAESIARQQNWYSKYAYRWELLAEVARSRTETAALPDLCSNDQDRGLLEWRLALDAIDRTADKREHQYLEVTYDELVDDGDRTVERLLGFLELAPAESVSRFVDSAVARRHPKVTRPLTADEQVIAGPHGS
jgi:hypothetical protein